MGPGGEAILEYSVYDALRAGFGKVVFVIRKDIEADFRDKVGRRVEQQIHTEYAFQEFDTALDWLSEKPYREKPWGTGHAILSAKKWINEPFATVNADDFYGADAFQTLARFLARECSPQRYGMVAYKLGNTLSENGSVSRGVCTVNDAGLLVDVVERTKIQRLENGIHFTDGSGDLHFLADDTPVSMNLWGLHHSVMDELESQFREFVGKSAGNPKAEFFIPTVINNLLNESKITLKVLHSDSQWYGVTYPEDKEIVRHALAGMGYRKGLFSR